MGVLSRQKCVKEGDWIVAVNGHATVQSMHRELHLQGCLVIRLGLKVQPPWTAEQQLSLLNASTAWDPLLKEAGWKKFRASTDAWNPKYWWHHAETGRHFVLEECPSNGWKIFSYANAHIVYYHVATQKWFDE